jgi:membrane protease YdiL (CAAX protease family)
LVLETMKWRWPTVWSGERGGWWRLPAALALFEAGAHLGGMLSSVAVPASSRGGFNPNNPATMKEVMQTFAGLLPRLLALAGLLAAIRFVHHKPVGCVFTDGRRFKVRLAIQSAAVWALLWFVSALGEPEGWEHLVRRAGEVSPAWWPMLVLSVFAATLVVSSQEEVLFRGYLQPRLGAWVKYPWIAVGIPAALFTVIHPGSSLAAYAGLAFVGALWGAAGMRAGTLAPLIGIHAMNNAVNGLWYPNGSNAGVTWVAFLVLVIKLVIWFGWLLWATRSRPVEALAQADVAADRSQPIDSKTNRTSAVTGPVDDLSVR